MKLIRCDRCKGVVEVDGLSKPTVFPVSLSNGEGQNRTIQTQKDMCGSCYQDIFEFFNKVI